jgi:Zn-dependent metalloprotease
VTFICDYSNYAYNKAFVACKAAYLLAEGDFFNGCTIRGIGLNRLEQIWYRALVHYFVSSETFNGAYAKLQQAAVDLYPADKQTIAQVRRAFQAVEMDQPGKCSGIPARVPQALDIQGW